MTGLLLLCAGRVKERYYEEAAAEYRKRLGLWRETRVVEVREEPGDTASALRAEAKALRAKIPHGAFVIALCVEGKTVTSEELASLVADTAQTHSQLCVLIGSSNGLDEALKREADVRLSLSKMTLPHSLSRVVALEQLYRAFSIIEGGKYHK